MSEVFGQLENFSFTIEISENFIITFRLYRLETITPIPLCLEDEAGSIRVSLFFMLNLVINYK